MDNKISEKELLQSRLQYIETLFTNQIQDENIREYIFAGSNIKKSIKRVPDYVSYIENILNLAFIFAHSCLRCDQDSEEPISLDAKKHNSLRIINSLKKAYIQYPATSDLVQFVLSDIQFDMFQGRNGELSDIFENLCVFKSKNFTLSKYYKLIATWKLSPSRFAMNSCELAGLFCELVENMVFLSNYELIEEDGDYVFYDKKDRLFGRYEKYSRIPTYHLLFTDRTKYYDFYRLFSVEKTEEGNTKKLSLRYVSNDGYNSLVFDVFDGPADETQNHIDIDAEEYYAEISGLDWDYDFDSESNGDQNFIDQVHAINYKYIKNLALSISDAISANRGSKEALYNAFHARHSDIFGKITSADELDSIGLDWDAIIIMLLIESSPTNVLEVLIHRVPQTFFDIVSNLCRRIDNSEMAIYGLSEEQLNEKVEDTIRNKTLIEGAGDLAKLPKSVKTKAVYARAAAALIISSLSAVHNDEERAIFTGNLYDNVSLLAKMKTDFTAEQRCEYVTLILGETFRRLNCFYKGLLAYGEIKNAFDIESGDICLAESKISQFKDDLTQAFFSVAKEQNEALSHLDSSNLADVITMINKFIELCEQCGSAPGNTGMDGQNLFCAVGKHEILNISKFKAFVRDYVDTLKEITCENVDTWLDFTSKLLKFLRTGSFSDRVSEERLIHTIYPVVATYNRGNENYDGYKTVTFSLNLDLETDSDSRALISVLTEFKYDLSEVFYCLPNILRSNKRWWIDPVLISFKEFNDIFKE